MMLMTYEDNDDENAIDYDFIPACSRFDFGTFGRLAENRHNKAKQKTDDRGDYNQWL